MKYAHVQQDGFIAAQVLQISDDGFVMARAFIQPNGSLGAYSQERGNIRWEGRTYATEDEARKPMFSRKTKLARIPCNGSEVSSVPEGAVFQREDDTGILFLHEGRYYVHLKEQDKVVGVLTEKEFKGLMRSMGVQ